MTQFASKPAEAMESLSKTLADKGKTKAEGRIGALTALKAILTDGGKAAEPFVAPLLAEMLDSLSDKFKPVASAGESAIEALTSTLSAHAVRFVLPAILNEDSGKWQCNLGRAQLLGVLADKFPAQTRRHLTEIIPCVGSLVWDTKPVVKGAAVEALRKVASTMTNKDLTDFIPEIIECIQNPELVAECVHKLAGVVFVQEIDASALAIMAPLLKRGFDEPTTAIKRNTARIVENMAKLVDDPYEVAPFVPLLLPALTRAKEEVSDPECRNVCSKAHEQLSLTSTKPPVWKRIEIDEVKARIVKICNQVKKNKHVFSLSLNVAPPLLPYVQKLIRKKKKKCVSVSP